MEKLVLSHQCVSTEVLVKWSKSSFPHFRIKGAASDNFCNFLKPTIQQARPLQAGLGQMCGGEKECRIWTSLSSSLFFILHTAIYVTFCVYNPGAPPWLPLKYCPKAFIPISLLSPSISLLVSFRNSCKPMFGWHVVWHIVRFKHTLAFRFGAVVRDQGRSLVSAMRVGISHVIPKLSHLHALSSG